MVVANKSRCYTKGSNIVNAEGDYSRLNSDKIALKTGF